jgi:DsbC/DsbD-like thiol-disulfide interchange protein
MELALIRSEFVAFLGFFAVMAAGAQAPPQPVSWSVTAVAVTAAKPGVRLTLDLAAHMDEGWHVYGLHQVEGGPTPLRITVDPNGAVQSAGVPSGTPPTKTHDKSFNLDTEVYLNSFSLHVPVQINPQPAAGNQEVAVQVRFQACNDHVCLPPKTVHLTVPVQIPTGTP